MFKELDPLLHSQLRLAVISILLSVEEAEFVYLREKTQATAGNLSVQIDKLSEAGYIEVEKSFVGKEPQYHLPDNTRRTTGIRELRKCPERLYRRKLIPPPVTAYQ